MAAPGYQGALKVSGASTSMTGEACGSLSSTLYQVTNSAKRIINPAVAATVKDGGSSLVEGTDYYLDRLFGRIILATTPGGAITIDAAYLATQAVAEVRKAELQAARAQLDKTTFDATDGFRRFLPGLMAFDGSAEILSQPSDDLDSGTGGTQSFFSFLANGTAKLIEVTRAGKMWRAWVGVESIEQASELESIVACTIKFKGSAQAKGAGLMFEEIVPVFGSIP